MIFSFTNQKGGVGKTTTVLNLGASLSKMGKKILLLDLDPQANLTSGIGYKQKGKAGEKHPEERPTAYDVLVKNAPISKAFVGTKIENLYIIPSSLDLAGAEIELVNKISRESLLKKTLRQVESQYDYVFIDCPPSLGLLTINALVASQRVIIPIQCEYFALEGLSQLAKTVDMIKKNLNSTLRVGGVVLTMYDARTKLSKEVTNEVKSFFKNKVFKTIIPRNIKLSEAPSHGVPILMYEEKAPGAVAYKKLAKEFVERFG